MTRWRRARAIGRRRSSRRALHSAGMEVVPRSVVLLRRQGREACAAQDRGGAPPRASELTTNWYRPAGKGVRHLLHKVAAEYPRVQARGWRLWPVAAMVNYKFVPLPLRVLFLSCVALGWCAPGRGGFASCLQRSATLRRRLTRACALCARSWEHRPLRRAAPRMRVVQVCT
jgi:Mpv17 / PMP22 family